jgi:hypothetical protein
VPPHSLSIPLCDALLDATHGLDTLGTSSVAVAVPLLLSTLEQTTWLASTITLAAANLLSDSAFAPIVTGCTGVSLLLLAVVAWYPVNG